MGKWCLGRSVVEWRIASKLPLLPIQIVGMRDTVRVDPRPEKRERFEIYHGK